MKLTSTRITTSVVASAALAGGMLAIGGTTAAGQPFTSQSTVGRAAPTTGDSSSPVAAAPSQISPGDLRIREFTPGQPAAPTGLLPGDVRMWELLHPWRP